MKHEAPSSPWWPARRFRFFEKFSGFLNFCAHEKPAHLALLSFVPGFFPFVPFFCPLVSFFAIAANAGVWHAGCTRMSENFFKEVP
jgi:hypothetical protein